MKADTPHSEVPLRDSLSAVAFVQSSHLFSDFADNALDALIDAGRLLEYRPGQLILSEGAVSDHLFLIFDGRVRVFKRQDGITVELAQLDRPAVFGETGVLMQRTRNASVQAIGDCRLVRFAGDTVRALADEAPKFGRLLATLMAGRSKETERILQQAGS